MQYHRDNDSNISSRVGTGFMIKISYHITYCFKEVSRMLSEGASVLVFIDG